MIDARDESELFNIAQMQGVHGDWSRTLPEGMNRIDDKYYLAVPNGWEGRLWWYEWWLGKHYWDGQAESTGVTFGSTNGLNCNERDRDRYHKQHQFENEYMIYDKVIIDFGSATTFESENWAREITADEVNTVFKMKIVANGTIKFNLTLNNDNSPRKAIIDFGDGTTTEDLTSSHTYTGSGNYILTCKLLQGSTVNKSVYSDTTNYWELPNKWFEVSSSSMIKCIALHANALTPKPYALNFSGLNMPILHLDYLGDIEKQERVMFRDCTITNVICWHKGRIAYIWLSGNSNITTYHTATNIESIYIVGQNRISYSDNANMGTAAEHYTNIKYPTNVYIHSDRLVNIYGYSYDRDFCDYATPNINFYVRNAILNDMKKMYPMLNFTGW